VSGSFFVGGFLYVAIGMAYNYKFKGQTGVEMVPNIEFWRGLPSLLKVHGRREPRVVVFARADLLLIISPSSTRLARRTAQSLPTRRSPASARAAKRSVHTPPQGGLNAAVRDCASGFVPHFSLLLVMPLAS